MIKMTLNGDWTASGAKFKEIKAKVPGCIHTDLLDNDLIKDPYYRDNESILMYIGESDWSYIKTFNIDESIFSQGCIKLVCHGLDTFAGIYINGVKIAETNNMFRKWEFDIKNIINNGENTIKIIFSSTYPYIQEKINERCITNLGPNSPHITGGNYVRKMQCNYGWDWGPKCVTAGIWRDIEIIGYNNVKINDIQIKQNHKEDHVDLDVISNLDCDIIPANMKIKIYISFEGKEIETKISCIENKKIYTAITIDDPKKWWPNNLGEQNLYDISVSLMNAESVEIDIKNMKIGLRTLELDMHKDQWGESFQFVVNGVPFFAKGANWIPIDTFVSRGSNEFYRQLIKDAKDANMNFLRVWGGGIYEQDVFYELCDELGICVWQDFMFACFAYPVYDKEYLSTFKQEAIDNIIRIRNHSCIALWCGNNEIEHMGGMISDKIRDGAMTWDEYRLLFEDIIPSLLKQYDGQHSYWVSSPMTIGENRSDPNDPTRGDAHLWDVWHGRKPFEWYRTCRHRFNSEFGFQAFPEPSVVNDFTIKEDRNIASFVMEKHQRSGTGNELIIKYMLSWFQLPTGFDMLLWTSQILQSLAIKYAVEHWRRKMPMGMGTLYWQFNDCWPVASWSSIDYIGNWKALHYKAKEFYNPILLSGIEDKEKLSVDLYLSNDLRVSSSGIIKWELYNFKGGLIKSESFNAIIDANKSEMIQSIDLLNEIANAGGVRNVVLFYTYTVDDKIISENTTFFERPKHLMLQRPEYMINIKKQDSKEYIVDISTDKPALWVWPDIKGMKAKYSKRFFDLYGDRVKTVLIKTEKDMNIEEFSKKLSISSIVDTY